MNIVQLRDPSQMVVWRPLFHSSVGPEDECIRFPIESLCDLLDVDQNETCSTKGLVTDPLSHYKGNVRLRERVHLRSLREDVSIIRNEAVAATAPTQLQQELPVFHVPC